MMLPTVIGSALVPGLLVVPILGAPERAECQNFRNIDQIHLESRLFISHNILIDFSVFATR